jgi:hypothetical protein
MLFELKLSEMIQKPLLREDGWDTLFLCLGSFG